ncbi:radical SAM family heme chaperone HemW [Metabacillus sp. GX 13764]|uniref:radical SAM family heme chaperone HemW n=1 Tax=Metabacillus kandeliae TaxID=2900151 RepID=UPI001E401F21|nr:radical SAM family heme chaperone HemW [Metabacillus kandeliae]
MQAAYIHIPFCEHICHYCDFNKVFIQNQPVEGYLESLGMELENSAAKYGAGELKSIFIGGGTPTALNESQLEKLLRHIQEKLRPGKSLEFSVEANPGDLSFEKLQVLRAGGVNRLSIGVQSFQDHLLEKIGRVHRKEDVFRSVEDAMKAGFENISIDLMFGLPGQTEEDFRSSLKDAFSLDVQHYSAYSLIVEPKTVFYNLMQKGKLVLPQQEEEAVMYNILMDEMESHGFHQYEISNFALPGKESRHNLTYWNNEEYFGFGAGAHGYVKGVRTANAGVIGKYRNLISEAGSAAIQETKVSIEEQMEEEMFLGLRKTAGVSKKHFAEKFGIEMDKVFNTAAEEQKQKGLLEESGDSIRLTREGRLLGNEVFQAFLGLASLEKNE